MNTEIKYIIAWNRVGGAYHIVRLSDGEIIAVCMDLGNAEIIEEALNAN
ncbi:hypothetical protein SmphiM6_35 [Sinorhizobium phage phiM6]|nr:hypothetical protein SmphiM6_35 [Sinorhizobium phage phiM6]